MVPSGLIKDNDQMVDVNGRRIEIVEDFDDRFESNFSNPLVTDENESDYAKSVLKNPYCSISNEKSLLRDLRSSSF